VVTAKNAAQSKEIPMPKLNSKRQSQPRSNRSKTAGRKSAAAAIPHKSSKLKFGVPSAAGQRHRSEQQTGHPESKQTRIITMLRAPAGVTIDAMVHATGWKRHSVRGFLAGIVRKKLGLNLMSTAGASGRVYRITNRTASSLTSAITSHPG
jgi:hypothetical protein